MNISVCLKYHEYCKMYTGTTHTDIRMEGLVTVLGVAVSVSPLSSQSDPDGSNGAGSLTPLTWGWGNSKTPSDSEVCWFLPAAT